MTKLRVLVLCLSYFTDNSNIHEKKPHSAKSLKFIVRIFISSNSTDSTLIKLTKMMEIKRAAKKNSKEYQLTVGWAKIITKFAKATIELLYEKVDKKFNLCKNTIRVSYSNPIIKCDY